MVEEALGGRDPGSAWRDQSRIRRSWDTLMSIESVHSVDKTARGHSLGVGSEGGSLNRLFKSFDL